MFDKYLALDFTSVAGFEGYGGRWACLGLCFWVNLYVVARYAEAGWLAGSPELTLKRVVCGCFCQHQIFISQYLLWLTYIHGGQAAGCHGGYCEGVELQYICLHGSNQPLNRQVILFYIRADNRRTNQYAEGSIYPFASVKSTWTWWCVVTG